METSMDAGQSAQPLSALKSTGDARSMTRRFRPTDSIVRVVLLFCGVLSIFTTLGIVGVLGQETLLFFDSRAFVLAKVPVIDQDEIATLLEPMDAEANTIVIDTADEGLTEGSFVQINNEIILVNTVGVAPFEITVERGTDSTAPLTHDAGTPVYILEKQVIAQSRENISDIEEVLSIATSTDAASEDSLDSRLLQIGDEIVRVTETGDERLIVTVERGQAGTTAREFTGSEEIALLNLTQIATLTEPLESGTTAFSLAFEETAFDQLSAAGADALIQIGDDTAREVLAVTDPGVLRVMLEVERGQQVTTPIGHEVGEDVGLLEPITLSEPIDADETSIGLSFEGQRVPFANEQFVRIGSEVVQVQDRGRVTMQVARGQDGTEAIEHGEGDYLFGMLDTQVRPLTELPEVQSIIRIPWEEVQAEFVMVGDEVEYLDQLWRVDDFNTSTFTGTCVEPRERRIDEFPDVDIRLLPGQDELPQELLNTQVGARSVTWVITDLDGGRISAACVESSEATINWSSIDDPMVRNGNDLEYEGQTWFVSGYDPETVEIQRCNADQESTIQLEEGFGHAFVTGDVIQIGLEIMEIRTVTDNTLTVERCIDGTNGYAHTPDNGRFESISLADNVSLLEFFTGTAWQPQIGDFGIWPLLLATLIVSTIAMFVSIPLGLGAAIYLSEYAPRSVRGVLKPILEVLAGVPTVVYGFFALTFVSPSFRSIIGEQVQYYNMLSAGVVVGILIIPYISTLSEDAINAVPRALREASYGLGATKLETTIKVVLPAAISGILAAFIIGISRAVGETMIVAIAAGSGPNFTFNVFEGAETMTGHIARISGGDLSYNSIDYNSIFSIAALLFAVTLTLNLISNYISNKLREAY